MKIFVNQNTCMGCSLCVSLCETIFTIDDNGLATVITTACSTEVMNDLLEATNCCPVNAISVEE